MYQNICKEYAIQKITYIIEIIEFIFDLFDRYFDIIILRQGFDSSFWHNSIENDN